MPSNKRRLQVPLDDHHHEIIAKIQRSGVFGPDQSDVVEKALDVLTQFMRARAKGGGIAVPDANGRLTLEKI